MTVTFELQIIYIPSSEILFMPISLMAMKFHCSNDKKHSFKNIILNLCSDLTLNFSFTCVDSKSSDEQLMILTLSVDIYKLADILAYL